MGDDGDGSPVNAGDPRLSEHQHEGSDDGSAETTPKGGGYKVEGGDWKEEDVESGSYEREKSEYVDGQACKVCGDNSVGSLFGSVVCVPCKTFFLRYGSDCKSFKCKFGGNCTITPLNRTRCKYCRYQRCSAIGMWRRVRPVEVQVKEGQQACVVCGDLANGVHFGAITCEGCKKFFRRGLVEHDSYVCKNSKQCPINPQTRNSCRHCRYQKCIVAGMSREAIQMGRPSKMKSEALKFLRLARPSTSSATPARKRPRRTSLDAKEAVRYDDDNDYNDDDDDYKSSKKPKSQRESTFSDSFTRARLESPASYEHAYSPDDDATQIIMPMTSLHQHDKAALTGDVSSGGGPMTSNKENSGWSNLGSTEEDSKQRKKWQKTDGLGVETAAADTEESGAAGSRHRSVDFSSIEYRGVKIEGKGEGRPIGSFDSYNCTDGFIPQLKVSSTSPRPQDLTQGMSKYRRGACYDGGSSCDPDYSPVDCRRLSQSFSCEGRPVASVEYKKRPKVASESVSGSITAAPFAADRNRYQSSRGGRKLSEQGYILEREYLIQQQQQQEHERLFADGCRDVEAARRSDSSYAQRQQIRYGKGKPYQVFQRPQDAVESRNVPEYRSTKFMPAFAYKQSANNVNKINDKSTSQSSTYSFDSLRMPEEVVKDQKITQKPSSTPTRVYSLAMTPPNNRDDGGGRRGVNDLSGVGATRYRSIPPSSSSSSSMATFQLPKSPASSHLRFSSPSSTPASVATVASPQLPPSISGDRSSPYSSVMVLLNSCQLFNEASKNPFHGSTSPGLPLALDATLAVSPPMTLDAGAVKCSSSIDDCRVGRGVEYRDERRGGRPTSCDTEPPSIIKYLDSAEQFRITEEYWLRHDELPDESLMLNEKHFDIINQIVLAYKKFLQCGTNTNVTLKKELESWNLHSQVPLQGSLSLPEWIQAKVIPVYTFSSITYCKSLPGFTELPLSDQATLIRLGQTQSRIMLAAIHWFDPAKKEFNDFLSWRPLDLFKQRLISYAEKIHQLKLDFIESALLNALVLIAADYPGLENPTLMNQMRQKILLPFRAYTTAKFGTPNHRMEALFRHIPETRELGFLHYKMTMKASLRAEEVEKNGE